MKLIRQIRALRKFEKAVKLMQENRVIGLIGVLGFDLLNYSGDDFGPEVTARLEALLHEAVPSLSWFKTSEAEK